MQDLPRLVTAERLTVSSMYGAQLVRDSGAGYLLKQTVSAQWTTGLCLQNAMAKLATSRAQGESLVSTSPSGDEDSGSERDGLKSGVTVREGKIRKSRSSQSSKGSPGFSICSKPSCEAKE